MAIDSERTEPRSRRAILAGAIGGVAAVVASRFASPDKTSAVHLPGFGHANAAGAADTSLTTSSAGTALLVTQNGAGTALRGSAVGPGSIAGFFTAQNGTGVSGVTGNPSTYGVFAANNGAAGPAGAIRAAGGVNTGVVATTNSLNGRAILGTNSNGPGIWGRSLGTDGSFGIGVQGGTDGQYGSGVWGHAGYGSASSVVPSNGVQGSCSAPFGNGVLGQAGTGAGQYAVYSEGNAHVQGNLTISGSITKGSGTFKIDHPLDPANKFLSHSFVESPDMMSVYNGNATTDAKGDATVKLPAYFGALNKDFRYQLTTIGAKAQAWVSAKVVDNTFRIKTDQPNVEVSWQVTGVRQDAYANANRIVPEVAKAGAERGKYLHPEVYGQPDSKGIGSLRRIPMTELQKLRVPPTT